MLIRQDIEFSQWMLFRYMNADHDFRSTSEPIQYKNIQTCSPNMRNTSPSLQGYNIEDVNHEKPRRLHGLQLAQPRPQPMDHLALDD